MDEAETVTADDVEVSQEPEVETQEEGVEDTKKVEHVPLSALQKERKRRKESDQRIALLESQLLQLQQANTPKKEDDSDWEGVTKGELKNHSEVQNFMIMRSIKESDWLENNKDKLEIINEKLPELLKQKPHLKNAVGDALNRYQEAWEQIMGHSKLKEPKERVQKQNNAPGSPANLPKSAGVNQGFNVMEMTDAEFNEWRAKQRKKR